MNHQNSIAVTFTHPFNDTALTLDLARDIRFSDITKLLYENGFLKRKKGGYQYIIDQNLCSLGEKLGSYAYHGDALDVKIHGLLTILA